MPGEILQSNVGVAEEVAPPPKKRGFPLFAMLVGVVVVALAAVGFFAWSLSRPAPRPISASPTVAPLERPTPAAANPPSTTSKAPAATTKPRGLSGALRPVNGISCDALESTRYHIHVHVAIFIEGQPYQVPYGAGVGRPLQVSEDSDGPFVEDGACFYWLHTHTEDGVVHIESPARRDFTLGDFFAIWQEPISATEVGPGRGNVIAYVNGERVTSNPAEIPLTQHALIQLNVGVDVPLVPFEFARGD
jgi:hypothetical protein